LLLKENFHNRERTSARGRGVSLSAQNPAYPIIITAEELLRTPLPPAAPRVLIVQCFQLKE